MDLNWIAPSSFRYTLVFPLLQQFLGGDHMLMWTQCLLHPSTSFHDVICIIFTSFCKKKTLARKRKRKYNSKSGLQFQTAHQSPPASYSRGEWNQLNQPSALGNFLFLLMCYQNEVCTDHWINSSWGKNQWPISLSNLSKKPVKVADGNLITW